MLSASPGLAETHGGTGLSREERLALGMPRRADESSTSVRSAHILKSRPNVENLPRITVLLARVEA